MRLNEKLTNDSMADITNTYYYMMKKIKSVLSTSDYADYAIDCINEIEDILGDLQDRKSFTLKHLAVLDTFKSLVWDIYENTEVDDKKSIPINFDELSDEVKDMFEESKVSSTPKQYEDFGLNKRISFN